MFQGLPGMFVPGLMIFFSVVRRGNTVRLRGKIVHLRGSIMFVFWHDFLLMDLLDFVSTTISTS